jgi:hypothetical protein
LLRVPSTLFLILQLASNIENAASLRHQPRRASVRSVETYQLSLRLGRPKTKKLP